jgi:hypothetical protein
MSKPERIAYIASLVSTRRATLARLVDSPDISPAQFSRIKRKLSSHR